MTYKVYILFSENFKRTYVGFSEEPIERLKAHNSGKVKATARYKPWKIVYEEVVEGYKEVRKRELYYKSGAGRKKIKSIFANLILK
jgi:putative endonuclease